MLTLAAEAIIVLCVLSYAMHCLLVVVHETAAATMKCSGRQSRFRTRSAARSISSAVVLIGLAPVGILARALRDVWLPDDPSLRFLLLAVPGLWLFLPVAIFSSLSASSRWFVFRPVVVWNLLRLTPFTFMVYFSARFWPAAVAALGYVTIASGWLIVAPLAAAAAAAAFLIYGRLLGRLGGKMSRLTSAKRKPMKKVRPAVEATEGIDRWIAPARLGAPEESDPNGKRRHTARSNGVLKDMVCRKSRRQRTRRRMKALLPLNLGGVDTEKSSRRGRPTSIGRSAAGQGDLSRRSARSLAACSRFPGTNSRECPGCVCRSVFWRPASRHMPS